MALKTVSIQVSARMFLADVALAMKFHRPWLTLDEPEVHWFSSQRAPFQAQDKENERAVCTWSQALFERAEIKRLGLA